MAWDRCTVAAMQRWAWRGAHRMDCRNRHMPGSHASTGGEPDL